MLAARALAPDGSPVDGFRFDGALTVTYDGAEPVDAGIRVELELPRDGRPALARAGRLLRREPVEACTRIYPRFTPGRVDVARMESDAWSFRADRCATPAVFARGGGLVTTRGEPARPVRASASPTATAGRCIWLDFPYREEPLRYDGSETPAPPDVQTYRWQPGERVELAFAQNDGDWRARSRAVATRVRRRRPGSPSRRRRRSRRTGSTAGTTAPTRRG